MIEQTDRDATSEWFSQSATGTMTAGAIVALNQAFAAHRIAAEQRGREAERAEIEGLRGEGGEPFEDGWNACLDAIEARQHKDSAP